MKKTILLSLLLLLFACGNEQIKTIDQSSDTQSDSTSVNSHENLFTLHDLHSTNEIPNDLSKFPKLDSVQMMQ